MPDPASGRPTGILVASHLLRDSNRISVADEAWLRERLAYFNKHLRVPSCLKDPANRRALSWFCEGSKMIRRVWDVKALMEEYDTFIDVVSTRDPGIILYEDEHQVVAFPRRARSRQAGASGTNSPPDQR